eukprot:COSAG02_NODE_21426_length_788_cov_1.275762_1_plen_42_part_10
MVLDSTQFALGPNRTVSLIAVSKYVLSVRSVAPYRCVLDFLQ